MSQQPLPVSQVLSKLSTELAERGAMGLSAIIILTTLREAEATGDGQEIPLPITVLAKAAGLGASATNGQVSRLRTRNLVYYTGRHGEDQRIKLIALTDEGREAADLAKKIMTN